MSYMLQFSEPYYVICDARIVEHLNVLYFTFPHLIPTKKLKKKKIIK